MHSSCIKGDFWVELLFGICASQPRNSTDRKCACFAGTFSVGLSKLNLACPEDTIWEKHLSIYLLIFFIFGLPAKISRMFGRNFFAWKKILFNIWLWANDSQAQATALDEFFGGKTFLRIEIFSHQFPTFSSWFSGFGQKTGRVIKLAF